jgi:hypothetical protein
VQGPGLKKVGKNAENPEVRIKLLLDPLNRGEKQGQSPESEKLTGNRDEDKIRGHKGI